MTVPAGRSPFEAKGLAYRGIVQELSDTVGWDAVLERCADDDVREFLRQPFLAASWYDVYPMVPLCEIGAELTGKSFAQFCRDSATRQAREDLSGVYRMVLRVVSPQMAVRAIIKVTKRYFAFGEAEITEMRERECRAVRTGIPDYVFDWYTEVGRAYIEEVLLASGARSVTVDVSRGERGTFRGHPVTDQVYEIRWT